MESKFQIAAKGMEDLARANTNFNLNNTEKLEMYKYYKQATVGDVEGSRPGMFSMKARAKWDAWNSVKGMTKEEAQTAYVEFAKKFVAADVVAQL